MKIIDLTHPISTRMPVYPGTEPPQVLSGTSLEKDGFLEHRWMLFSHTGTHIDAPAHVLLHAPTLDRLPVHCFVGKSAVIDLTKIKGEISVPDLQPFSDDFRANAFILLHTGWSRFWGQNAYFNDYPVLSMEAALWMDSFGLKCIGIDAISFDHIDNHSLSIHKILLEHSILVENLTGLDQLPHDGFFFSCLPLKWEEADGSPVRAVAMIG